MKMCFLLLLFGIASVAQGEIYTWKDAKGTTHYTNSLYEIPSRALAKAKVLDIATGKKTDLTGQQQPGQLSPPVQKSSQPSLGSPPPAVPIVSEPAAMDPRRGVRGRAGRPRGAINDD